MPDRWRFAATMYRNMQQAGLSESRAMQIVCESINEMILEDGKIEAGLNNGAGNGKQATAEGKGNGSGQAGIGA